MQHMCVGRFIGGIFHYVQKRFYIIKKNSSLMCVRIFASFVRLKNALSMYRNWRRMWLEAQPIDFHGCGEQTVDIERALVELFAVFVMNLKGFVYVVKLNVKDADCRFGMIKLGCQYSKKCTCHDRCSDRLRQDNGAGIMGWA